MALALHFTWSSPGCSCSGSFISAQETCRAQRGVGFHDRRKATESKAPVSMSKRFSSGSRPRNHEASNCHWLFPMPAVMTPKVMNKAVDIPGSLVLIGALVGGTLLGLLGALVAVPVTATLLMIVNTIFIPRQDAKLVES